MCARVPAYLRPSRHVPRPDFLHEVAEQVFERLDVFASFPGDVVNGATFNLAIRAHGGLPFRGGAMILVRVEAVTRNQAIRFGSPEVAHFEWKRRHCRAGNKRVDRIVPGKGYAGAKQQAHGCNGRCSHRVFIS